MLDQRILFSLFCVYKIMSVGLEVYLFVRFLYIEKKIWVQGVVPAFFNLTLFLGVGSYFGYLK